MTLWPIGLLGVGLSVMLLAAPRANGIGAPSRETTTTTPRRINQKSLAPYSPNNYFESVHHLTINNFCSDVGQLNDSLARRRDPSSKRIAQLLKEGNLAEADQELEKVIRKYTPVAQDLAYFN